MFALTLRTVTGLIYVVIIALWAAVLIPIWLRRHDQISEVRSTARFSSAMKSLGSQGQVQYATDSYPLDGHAMEMALPPRRSPEGEARMPRSTTTRPTTTRPVTTRPVTTRPAEGLDPDYERELVRQAAATRRAIVLGALTVILLVALVLAIVGVLPQWAPIVAALPVVVFVLASSMTASARTSARSSARPNARPARRTSQATEADPVRQAAPAAAAQVEDDWETWNAWDDEDSWEAVPQTLPTYVSAPRASAVPRGIDRAHPGEWTGEAMVETARAMRSRPRSAPLADPSDIDHGAMTAEIPVIADDYDQRRAVNE
jgi:hypothetical protein